VNWIQQIALCYFFKKVNEDFLVDKMGVWHTRYFVFSGIGSGLSTLGSVYGKGF
jgi:hypothetical protein